MTDNTEALPPPPSPDEWACVGGVSQGIYTADTLDFYARAALAQRQQVPVVTDAMVEAAKSAYQAGYNVEPYSLRIRLTLEAALTAAPSAQAELVWIDPNDFAEMHSKENRGLAHSWCLTTQRFGRCTMPLYATPPTAQAEPQPKGYVKNCHIEARDDEPLFVQRVDGAMVAQLDGYRITPLEAAQAEPQEPLTEFLTAQDKADLLRIEDCFSDGEGYDLPRERMARLAELGVIRHNGGGVYSITAFGMYCTGAWPALPLKTAAESDAEAGRLHAERMAHGIGKQEGK